MKYLVLIPLVLVASCASHPKPRISVKPRDLQPSSRSRRCATETWSAPITLVVIDPNHPETMHEEHPIYRVEASARWDLHPGSRNVPTC